MKIQKTNNKLFLKDYNKKKINNYKKMIDKCEVHRKKILNKYKIMNK